VAEVARRFAHRLPCLEVVLGDPSGPRLSELLALAEVPA
jgi:hypothetical protein